MEAFQTLTPSGGWQKASEGNHGQPQMLPAPRIPPGRAEAFHTPWPRLPTTPSLVIQYWVLFLAFPQASAPFLDLPRFPRTLSFGT